ncbi:MAG: acyloxyacyl hydrolase [Vicinamibacterales bacterium]
MSITALALVVSAAHAGGGARVNVTSNQAFVLAYRFQHVSNADRLDRNPGVNSHMAFVGWSVRRRPRM